jgi:hypothetical protein
MSVRLGTGIFRLIDGQAIDDYEPLAAGTITSIPQVVGTAGCTLNEGIFLPREG